MSAVEHVRRSRELDVLVVDDDEDTVELFCFLMERAGHRCTRASAASAAIEQVSQRHFDVALLDVGLPDMDGLDLARRLHSLAAWMRLIAVTGHDGGALQGEARAAGVERVFLKPVDVEELLRAVEGREPAHASVSR